ncbi:DUF6463 family protein [Nonomuraea endophytica]|uniref:DUF6463 family protein n=1 Tax=Nonomuraea endophytica TaxID=714136 RepID=UPI0037C83842
MNRWIPRLTIALIGAHFLVSLVLGSSTLDDIAREGFWNTVPDDPLRSAEMWFFLAGFPLLALGTMSQSIVAATGRLPAQLGWYLLMVGVPLTILFPISGGPLLVVLGIAALHAARRSAAAPQTVGHPG